MSVARASAIMIGTLVASRILGWLRLSVIGAKFGETPDLDAFIAAFKIPDAIFGLLVLYQQFEDRYLVPRVYGSTLNLPPLIVLIAVLAGGELLGVTGVLLALPAAAAGRVALDYYMERRKASYARPGPAEEPFAPDS